MIGLKIKRHLFGAEKLKWFPLSVESTFQESVSKQNFYACERAKKAMSSRHSTYIPSSVKSPLQTTCLQRRFKKQKEVWK